MLVFSKSKLYREGALMQRTFFLESIKHLLLGDVILAETGTAGHGCRDFKLLRNTRLIKHATWLSIGYMLPVSQGVALAQQDSCKTALHHQRTILLIEDGSFQKTAQELSTVMSRRAQRCDCTNKQLRIYYRPMSSSVRSKL